MSNVSREPSFGSLLRQYRERSVDKYSRRPLSQEGLARRLSDKRGLIFDRNTIGKWEANRRTILADDRRTLIDLLAILIENGGITTIEDADRLLEIGNYRKLSERELSEINPSWKLTFPIGRVMRGSEVLPDNRLPQDSSESVSQNRLSDQKIISPRLENIVQKAWRKLDTLLDTTKDGPQPSWPRVVVTLGRGMLERWTIVHALKVLLWLWLWLFAWLMLAPSLRWPFANREQAFIAIVIYVAGTFLIPPLIAILIKPKNNQFWLEQKLATSKTLYLYVYQGAGIGFHLGYFLAFLLALLGYHVHLSFSIWAELSVTILPLMLGYIAAQLIPFNLWRAYGRLDLADGAIFFIFLILGPAWGYFFLNFYATFLTPIVGLIVILLAATSLASLMAWQERRTRTTIIPAHWWLLLYGAIFILYEFSIHQPWWIVASLAGFIILLTIITSRVSTRLILLVMIGLLLALGLLLIVIKII